MKLGAAIAQGVTSVTKDWTTYRKKEFRDAQRGRRFHDELMRGCYREKSIKEAAYEVMEKAYMKASGNGRLPASARQIMYQARPLILERIEKKLGKDFDQYFTQQLLPNYMDTHSASWDVIFDARGHLWEPHTKHEIPLGTLAVRKYIGDARGHERPSLESPKGLSDEYSTMGPANRYRNVLFIEKEGFMPLFEETEIAERYDLAIMSTKGVASTAARLLMERLGRVRFLVLHDFDKGGFTILGTLKRDTRRYAFMNPPEVIDLGIRLADIEAEGLLAEPVYYHERDPRPNLRENGATKTEIDFLVTSHREGRRVELNAFPSDQLIEWLERKLEQHHVTKIIPDAETLATAYKRAMYTHLVNAEIGKAHETAKQTAEASEVPTELNNKVAELLKEDATLSWDVAVAQIAGHAS